MTARVWPVDAVTGVPSYTGRSLRQTLVAPLLGGATAARPLGGFSGVRPGTPSSIVSATSTTWTVTPFAGTIDGETLAIAGPYEYAFDANVTGSVTAAAVSARVDRLDVQVSDPAESDGSSTPGIAVVYNAGTPGTGVPVTAPARSHPLAYINVPASGGGSPTITWVAPFLIAAGGILPALTLALLPASGSYIGQRAEVFADSTTTNNGMYRWSGTTWAKQQVRVQLGDVYVPTASVTTLGTSMADVTSATVTATSSGGRVRVTAITTLVNAGSGGSRTGQVQLLCDGVLVGEASVAYTLLFSTLYQQLTVTITATSTPSAGSHTWKLQGAASAASSVQATQTTLMIEEYV